MISITNTIFQTVQLNRYLITNKELSDTTCQYWKIQFILEYFQKFFSPFSSSSILLCFLRKL